MWALINPTDDTVLRVFPRPTAFQLDDINHPSSIFKDSEALMRLDILPVRRVQLGAPADGHGWSATHQFVVELDHVREEVSWAEDDDGQAQRDERDAKALERSRVSSLETKRQALHKWMHLQGFYTEAQLTGGDLLAFEATLS